MRALAVISIALLAATPAFAQLGGDLGGLSLDAPPPFALSAVIDRTAVVYGETFRVGVVLEAAPLHKIYRSSVKVALDSHEYLSVLDVRVPQGDPLPPNSGAPAGETALHGRTVVVVTLRAVPKDKTPLGFTAAPARFTIDFQGCSEAVCYPPEVRTLFVDVPLTDDPAKSTPANVADFPEPIVSAPSPQQPPGSGESLADIAARIRAQENFAAEVEARGVLVALLAAFGSGFLVSLTPCVWPLIPIILAIVGANAEGSGWKRGLGLSLVYVTGMALTYAVFGAVAGALGHSVQGLMQNPWLIGAVVAVFVALALSMFGLYDIALPSSVAGKLQQKRGAGALGVLVTGAVSGLVASPCVSAPLLGLFAGVATLGSIWIGALAGFIFALGMGVILIVAGTSSKALAALPRSGQWMVSIKHFFGWVMLGAAVYFSEMLLGAGYFNIGMLVLLAAALGYSASAFTTSQHRVALSAGLLVLACGVAYFAHEAASGFAPAEHAATTSWETSLGAGLARAKAEKKPAIVDVTAAWCVYCREMERDVFAKPSFADESRRFVMVRFDATTRTPEAAAFFKEYSVVGPPAYVFFRADGSHETVNGKVDLDKFLALMRATK